MKTTTLSVAPPLPPFRFWGNLGQFWAISHRLSVRTALRPPPSPSLPPKHSVCVSGGTTVPLCMLCPLFFWGGGGEKWGAGF